MKLECPHCSQRIEIPPEFFGATVNCPGCGGEFTVPFPDGSPETPQELLPPASSAPPPLPPPAPPAPPLDPKIVRLNSRFTENEFRIDDPENTPDFPFRFSASKVRFDLVGAPTFLEEFFIFETFDGELNESQFNDFLDGAWEWALANENNMPKGADLSKKALRLVMKLQGGDLGRVAVDHLDQLSVRQATCLIYVYAIAIAPAIDPATLDWLWSKKSAAARKDGVQAAFVVPVFYDQKTAEFHHFKKRPILGNVYYTEARKVMKKRLID